MRELRKLRKLLRDPRRFVEDSPLYRRARELTGRNAAPVFRTTSVKGRPRLDAAGEALFQEVATALAAEVPCMDVSLPGQPILAVLAPAAHRLTSELHALQARGVSLEVVGGTTGPQLLHLDEALAKRPCATFVLERESASVCLEVQVWETDERQVTGPKAHPLARRISHHTCREHGFFQLGRLVHVRALLECPPAELVDFPIDVVYTWVSHSDPKWREMWRRTMGREPVSGEDDARSVERFISRDELRYSLRSIHAFAPWVRRVFVVSNCAPPSWVNVDEVTWVDHSEIIPEEFLPTFSSHAIESRLHHVPDLSEHFLYFNDDFFLMRALDPEHFFLGSGASRSFFESYATVNGAPDAADPDYLNAARNGQRLIQRDFGRTPVCLHKHTPYALRRSVLFEMEERYAEHYLRTVGSRTRAMGDLSTVSFFYHHYACLTNRAFASGREVYLLKPQSADYLERMQTMIAGRKLPVTLCLNDGAGSASAPHWGRHVVEFLEAMFSESSKFEV